MTHSGSSVAQESDDELDLIERQDSDDVTRPKATSEESVRIAVDFAFELLQVD